jgi:hypothetical protein
MTLQLSILVRFIFVHVLLFLLVLLQLRDLIAYLDTTGLHFVRCIKPNGALQPGGWLGSTRRGDAATPCCKLHRSGVPMLSDKAASIVP